MFCRVAGVIAIAILLGTTVGAEAQMRGLGRVMGTVVDEAGDPVDGVVLKAPYTGGTLETKSDTKGEWLLGGLGRGEWKVEVTKAGFKPLTMKVTIVKELDRLQPVKIVLKKP
ncbi:MAG: carboxypeptidase regulatory-like domain-containing protein [Vicinamibacteraceae bacterium]|nr:carboxypeptidase regulatory-like domain-containing protein [Vicinamibacteraceae bacterium]